MSEAWWGNGRPRAGRVFIVSGPSGVGKDTVLARLLRRAGRRLHLKVAVTDTSRAKRPGERNGHPYHFKNVEHFEAAIAAGEYLEHARFDNHYYGTPRSAIACLNHGTNLILKIEVQGAASARLLLSNPVTIFIAPPSMDELLWRHILRGVSDLAKSKAGPFAYPDAADVRRSFAAAGRSSGSPGDIDAILGWWKTALPGLNTERIAARLHDAAAELEAARSYDYLIVNSSVNEADKQIEAIILAELHRILRA